MAESITIEDRPEASRYELADAGRLAGFVTYRLEPGQITFEHTEVDPAFAGRGFGTRLAVHVLEDARGRGLRVIPRCPFIAGYIRRHPAYRDLLLKAPDA